MQLAVVSAVLNSLSDIGKHHLLRRTNSVPFVLLVRGASQFVVFALWVLWEGVPLKQLDSGFFASCFLLAVFNTFASVNYLAAIKVSPAIPVSLFFFFFFSVVP